MATIEFGGIEEYRARLTKLNVNINAVIKKAVYPAADIVADEIRKAVEALPEISEKEAIIGWKTSEPVNGVTPEQKKGLLDGLYLSKFQEKDGFIYVSCGFNGYNDVKTAEYPKGQPNSLIARAIESGSSARPRKPFIRPAVNRVAKAAETEIERQFGIAVGDVMDY